MATPKQRKFVWIYPNQPQPEPSRDHANLRPLRTLRDLSDGERRYLEILARQFLSEDAIAQRRKAWEPSDAL